MNVQSQKCFTLLSAICLFGISAIATADSIKAKLDGYQVVSTQSTEGIGRFYAKIDRENRMIEYKLHYQDLEGDILQSHIHFGRPGTNGGIVTFLCTNLDNDPSPSAAPTCPGPHEGMVSGIIQAEDVVYLSFPNVFPATQLIAPGEFDEVLKAIDAGATYIVVHTTAQPPGELRGDIPERKHDDD
ncbi:MAG: CHRD domain-containing protein [Gammaproteobacteria bacterium]